MGVMVDGSRFRMVGLGGWAAWAGVGALLSFSVLAAASIGLFVAPAALAALAATCVFVRLWPEVTGVFEGAAAVSLFVGLANLGTTRCPDTGAGRATQATPGTFSCGGLDPTPWLWATVILAGVGVLAYSLCRARP
jgi:hypothetical protein